MSDPKIYMLTRIQALEVNKHTVKVLVVLRIKVWGDWDPAKAVLTGSMDHKGRPIMDLAPLPQQHEVIAHEMRALESISEPETNTIVQDQTPDPLDEPLIDPALVAEFGSPDRPGSMVKDRERSSKQELLGSSDLSGVQRVVH